MSGRNTYARIGLGLGLQWLLATQALAARPVTELFDGVIEPPRTAEEAASWIRKGQLVDPKLLAQKHELEAERDAAGIKGAQASYAASGQGNIDLARMQSDPAYAAQVKQQMQAQAQQIQAMPRDQQIVAAMQLAAQQQAAMQTDISKMVREPPAVAQAVEGIRNAQASQLQNMTTSIQVVAERNRGDIEARYNPQYSALEAQYQDGGEGCDDACVAKIEANNRAVKARIVALATKELGEWRGLFAQLKTAHRGEIVQGQGYLSATDYGAAATSGVDRTTIETYHSSLVDEALNLLGVSIAAAQRAAGRY